MSKKIRHQPKLPAWLRYVVHYGRRPVGHVVDTRTPSRTVCGATMDARMHEGGRWGTLAADLGAGQRLCGMCETWRACDCEWVAMQQAASKAAIAVLALVGSFAASACGAPFESKIGPLPHEGGADVLAADVVLTPDAPDAPEPVDAHPADDAAHEGRHPEGGADVVQVDAPPPPPKDAGPPDVAPDVSPDIDAACALPPAELSVCDGMPAGGVEYCIQLGGGTSYPHSATPAACRCLTDYTCACVLADVADPCAGMGILVDCLTYDGVPVVRCK